MDGTEACTQKWTSRERRGERAAPKHGGGGGGGGGGGVRWRWRRRRKVPERWANL